MQRLEVKGKLKRYLKIKQLGKPNIFTYCNEGNLRRR